MRTTILPPAPEARDTIPAPPPEDCYDCGACDCGGVCGARDDRPVMPAPNRPVMPAPAPPADIIREVIEAALRGDSGAPTIGDLRALARALEARGLTSLALAAGVAVEVIYARADDRSPTLAVRAGLALLSGTAGPVGL